MSRHLKRYPAPRHWPIARKERAWTVKPLPGPHPVDRCLPMLIVIRDILGYAERLGEVKKLLAEGKVKVDGVVCREYKYPLGLMDVIEFTPTSDFYRILPSPRKGLVLHKIGVDEASFKLCRVEGKSLIKGGFLQLNLHDGRNQLVKLSNPNKPVEDVYKVFDTLKVSIPKQTILNHLKLELRKLALVIGGRKMGEAGRIINIASEGLNKRQWLLTLEGKEGRFQTNLRNILVIGDEKPLISLP